MIFSVCFAFVCQILFHCVNCVLTVFCFLMYIDVYFLIVCSQKPCRLLIFCFSKGPPQAAFLRCGKNQISLHSRPAPQLGNKEIEKQIINEKHIQIKHLKKTHENHALGNKTKINIEK